MISKNIGRFRAIAVYIDGRKKQVGEHQGEHLGCWSESGVGIAGGANNEDFSEMVALVVLN